MGLAGWDRDWFGGVKQGWVWRVGAVIGVEELRKDGFGGMG